MFVDIHSHILPKIDDGASDMETSVSMLKIACSNDITTIIATPHFIVGSMENKKEKIVKMCSSLNKKASQIGLNVKILPGSEVFISPDIFKLLEDGTICTLNNSSYILIEFPLTSIPPFTNDFLYRLQIKGYKPILAHPERNKEILKNPDILYDLVRRGIFIQMNSGSLTGIQGREIAKKSMMFLEHKMVHFISSDAHSVNTRSPDFSKAIDIVRKKFGDDTVDLLFTVNGMNVIENNNIESTDIY